MTARQFSDLYNEHYGKLFYFILGMVRNKAIAEDVTARAWMKAWEHRGQLNGNFKSWVFSIAANEARMLSRRDKVIQWEPIDGKADTSDPLDFTEEMARYQEYQRAARMAALLTKKLRQAMACHIRGLSLEESAVCMRVPIGTAGRRIFEARQKIKAMVQRADRRSLCEA